MCLRDSSAVKVDYCVFISHSYQFAHRLISFAAFFVKLLDESKSRKFKGALTLPEVSPNTVIESSIQFKKSIPAFLDKLVSEVSTLLRQSVSDRMKDFESEFKAL